MTGLCGPGGDVWSEARICRTYGAMLSLEKYSTQGVGVTKGLRFKAAFMEHQLP